jgi:hypothetical protein
MVALIETIAHPSNACAGIATGVACVKAARAPPEAAPVEVTAEGVRIEATASVIV